MSVDIRYYSFSPSRADKHWVHFVEDMKVLRAYHAPWKKYVQEKLLFDERKQNIQSEYEPRIAKIREKIFNFFDQQDYIIPWIEWNSTVGKNQHDVPMTLLDEDKMEYLKVWGCVYPRDKEQKKNDAPYLMLRMDAPDLEKEYDIIVAERNIIVQTLQDEFNRVPFHDETVMFNERQEALKRDTALSYLKFGTGYNEQALERDLIVLDIYYGSVMHEDFENPKLEYEILETLFDVASIKIKKDMPSRDEWLLVWRQMNNEFLQKSCERLAQKYQWNKDDARWLIDDYIREISPVMDDLSVVSDSMFIKETNDEIAYASDYDCVLLKQRVKKHMHDYQGQLPPVL